MNWKNSSTKILKNCPKSVNFNEESESGKKIEKKKLFSALKLVNLFLAVKMQSLMFK